MLNPDALVTIAEARAYLQSEADEDPDDGLLELIINGISARIADHTKRTYAPADDVSSARLFAYPYDARRLWIDDCRDVETVETTVTPSDPDAWAALDDADWIAVPLSKSVKDRVRLLAAAELCEPVPIAVRVTAKWGYASVPAHVKLAALMWLQSIHKRDVAFFSDELARTSALLRMPDDVRGILDDERRRSPAVVSIPVTR